MASARNTMLQAVHALYHHEDAEVRRNANTWLEEFQRTVESWQVVDGLLHDSSVPEEVHYFAAQTLRTKIQRDFEELPPEAGISLRDSVVSLLSRFASGPTAVRTQICLAVVGLAAHLDATKWAVTDTQRGAVQWLASRLGQVAVLVPPLLDVLRLLPEEAHSYKLAIRPERRRQLINELRDAVVDALMVLAVCWQQSGSLGAAMQAPGGAAGPRHLDVQTQILQAFASWLRLGDGLPPSSLVSHPLVAATLQSLHHEELRDAAIDAACELMELTAGLSVEAMPLVETLVPQVLALRLQLATLRRRAQKSRSLGTGEPSAHAVAPTAEGNGQAEGDDDDDEEDMEAAKAIARLFAEMGEVYIDFVAAGGPHCMDVVEALLEVASYPDVVVAGVSFNFWHYLSRAITREPEGGAQNPNQAHAQESQRQRVAAFTPAFLRLIQLVSTLVRYPVDFNDWHREERRDFKRSRYALADTLMDASHVVGGSQLLELLTLPLKQAASMVASGGAFDWRAVEASLCCVRAVAKSIGANEHTIMPQVMQMLPTLPLDHPQLTYTASLTVAAYADWLGAACQAAPPSPSLPSARQQLPNLLRMLTHALVGADDDAASAAALALRHVCETCGAHLADSLGALMTLYVQAVESGSGGGGQQGGDGRASPLHHKLTESDIIQLVEALCLCARTLPPPASASALRDILEPIARPLALAVAAGDPLTSTHLDRLACLFRLFDQPAPLADVLSAVWPSLQAAFARFESEPWVMERLARTCKFALRALGLAAKPLLPPLLAHVRAQYHKHPQPSMLYIASTAVKEFSQDADSAACLQGLVSDLFMDTVAVLHSADAFTASPDLADDCFLLASRCLRYCPRLLVPTPTLPLLLGCATTGATVQHREACRSILAFLVQLCRMPSHHHHHHHHKDAGGGMAADGSTSTTGASSSGGGAATTFGPYIEAALQQHGQRLVCVLLSGAGGALPESRNEEISDVLYALGQLMSGPLASWIDGVLRLLPSPDVMTDADKHNTMQVGAVQ
eukprot:jgi/Mesvir1/27672/Mv07393-RA.2